MIEYQLKSPALYLNLFAIRAKIYTIKSRLNASICPSAEPIPFAELNSSAFRDTTQGAQWGRIHSCAWLHIRGNVPEGMKDPVLLLDMTGEGLIYSPEGEMLDGVTAVWAGGDVRRSGGWRLAAELSGVSPGSAVDYYIDCGYNGFNFQDKGRGRFRGAYAAERDAEAFAYYYDYFTLLLLHSTTDERDRKRTIGKALRLSFVRFLRGDTAGARASLAGLLAAESESPLTFSAVGHGHLDLAWMWPMRESVRKASRTYTIALKNIERYPGYIYGTSQPQQLQWMKERYPELYKRVKQVILAGQIELQGGFWVECDCNVTSGESLVRQAVYGKRFAQEEFGLDMRMCWLPDAFGFNGNLPQILKGCSMDYFSTIKITWNRIYKFPYRTFWWEGIDGSRVLVHMPPEGEYNSAAGPHSLLKAFRNYPEKELDTALLVYGSGDGGGGPRESHMQLLKREHSLAGVPRVRFSTAIAFFDALIQKVIPQTWTGELYLDVHQGTYTTQGKSKRYNRLMERLLHDAEALAVLRAGEKPYPHVFFEEIWKETLLYQFHDILPGSSIARVYAESHEGYRRMEGRLNAAISDMLPPGGSPVAVNLTSFRRSEYVKLGDSWYHAEVPPYAAQPMQPFAKKDQLSCTGDSMSNGILTLQFNEYGEIVSCKNKDGHELAKGPLNRLMLYQDPFTYFNAWDINAHYYKKHSRRLRAEEVNVTADGPRLVRSCEYRTGKSVIRQNVILELHSDVVRFETTADWHETHRMLRADFFPADYGDSAEFEIQFGTMTRSTKSRDTYEASQFEVCGHKWASVHQNGRGFALLNDSKYGHRAKDGLLSLNLLRSPVFPDKTADRGEHAFTYAFCPLGADNAHTVEAGYCLNHPLYAGNYTPFDSIVSVSDTGVVLETIKQSEDGKAIVLRLYESLGRETQTALSPRIQYDRANFSDLVENPQEQADLTHLCFRPYEIKTIRLEGGQL